MILKQDKRCSWWLCLIGFLLISAITTLLFGGYKTYENYRKSVQPGLPLNLSTLHYFTKENLKRRYLKLTTKPLPETDLIPSFRFYAVEEDIASLESNLPSSAKTRFISGHITVDEPAFSSEMQFRYRGGLPLHWLHKKKSLRVKLPPFTSYNGAKSFNLVNPSTLHTVTDLVSYDMARSIGLLTPDYFPSRVFINDQYNGLHFYLNQVDESFLRKNRRMPGSIYSGDTIYIPNPFGKDKEGIRETSFVTDDGISLLWTDERLWDKDAARNAEQENDRTDIQKFISILNEPDPLQFFRDFRAYFDVGLFYKFWALDTIVGSYHHDNFHNHKIYFDPYKGKFEPIEWDIRFWSSLFASKDLPVNALLKQIILNPVLEYERDKAAYSLHKQFSVEQVTEHIHSANQIVRPELEADPYRHHPDSHYGRFELDKETPYSMENYDRAIEELKLIYANRYATLESIYNHSIANYSLKQTDDRIILTVSVSGNSPILFNPMSLVPEELRSQTLLERIFENEALAFMPETEKILYPGRKLIKGNAHGRADKWAILAFGKEKLLPSPMHYQYSLRGASISELNATDLKVENAITGEAVILKKLEELPDDQETASIHPWKLEDINNPETEIITLSGNITINEDKIFPEHSEVIIKAGTKIKLAKAASLVFYGKLIAEGNAEQPIIFTRLNKDEAWGSIVIQGKAASDSVLNHIHVDGGSITTQRLISYPGQLNIHDVDYFQLENCTIKGNSIGDDSLHVSYSKGIIQNCVLEDSAFDAIDIDIAEVKVSHIKFRNIGNDALDLMSSNITVSDVIIHDAGDKCFSVGENSQVNIHNSKLQNCNIGIAVKDESEAYIENLDITGYRQSAIALYRKNLRYSKGGTIQGKNLSGFSMNNIEADQASKVFIKESDLQQNILNESKEQ